MVNLEYFPKDVYEREIPKESLDLYMTSPPCQAFSLAGKRKGEDDERGICFTTHTSLYKRTIQDILYLKMLGVYCQMQMV